MENPHKTPLLEVRRVGKRNHRGLWSVRGTILRLGPGILRLVGPDRAFRPVLVAVSSAVFTALPVIVLLAGRAPGPGGTVADTLSARENTSLLRKL